MTPKKPTLRSLYGAVPNLTGGVESAKYIRAKRDKGRVFDVIIEVRYTIPVEAQTKEQAETLALDKLIGAHYKVTKVVCNDS